MQNKFSKNDNLLQFNFTASSQKKYSFRQLRNVDYQGLTEQASRNLGGKCATQDAAIMGTAKKADRSKEQHST